MQEAISKYLSKHGFEAFKPKAVLFDMDGVLYNSMPNHACAWQQAMAQFGITMTAHDAYATEGARGIDTIRMMVKAQQGHEISLEEAQKMCGMTIGVVTGSGQRPLLNRLLNDFGEFLDENHIVTAYDVKRGKPNPDPYLMGMQKVGDIQPWETIVVENAPLGVRAATAARCFTIAVNTGPLPDHSLTDVGADLLLPSLYRLCRQWDYFFQYAL